MIKSIGVFCGSTKGNNAVYEENAKRITKLIVQKNIEIVYGGSHIGLMGAIADEAITNNGKITGVIPTHLLNKELAHKNLSKLLIVKDMAEQKEQMICLSDAFLILPGGFGTLDELFEVITLNHLHLINKPCLIYNVNGYFDILFNFISHVLEQGFVKIKHLSIVIMDNDPIVLLSKLDYFSPKENLDYWKGRLKEYHS
ncbi:MAG: TIGR00730 family Rossman fold protein [Bacteroidota bacterium]